MKNKYRRLFLAISVMAMTMPIVGCGGSSDESEPNNLLVHRFNDVLLSNDLPRAIVARMDKNYHEVTEISFRFYSKGYFSDNPNAHAALVMRGNADTIQTKVEGVGMVFGNVSKAPNTIPGNPSTLPNPLSPSVQIETWFNGRDTDNFLLAPKNEAPILEDYAYYDMKIRSQIKEDKSIQTVQILIKKDGKLIWDSGVVDDPNKYIVSTYNDIVVGHVFNDLEEKKWLLLFSNIELRYYWFNFNILY